MAFYDENNYSKTFRVFYMPAHDCYAVRWMDAKGEQGGIEFAEVIDEGDNENAKMYACDFLFKINDNHEGAVRFNIFKHNDGEVNGWMRMSSNDDGALNDEWESDEVEVIQVIVEEALLNIA